MERAVLLLAPCPKRLAREYSSLSHKRRVFGRVGSAFEIMVCAAEFPYPQRDQPLLLPVDISRPVSRATQGQCDRLHHGLQAASPSA
jgi:hypothetical protein